jgi:hypothetical protein
VILHVSSKSGQLHNLKATCDLANAGQLLYSRKERRRADVSNFLIMNPFRLEKRMKDGPDNSKKYECVSLGQQTLLGS